MSAADDFIRAIRANPDDDAPRLIFADWLDENDQPERAEYIRGQIAVAQLHGHDPDRFALMTRTERLWQRHRFIWSAPLPAVVRSAFPARGLLDSLTIGGDDLRSLASIMRHHPFRQLTVEEVSFNNPNRSEMAPHDRRQMHVEMIRSIAELTQIRRFTYDSSDRGTGPNLLYELADDLPNLSYLDVIAATNESTGKNTHNLLRRFASHPIQTIDLAGSSADWVLTRLASVNLPHLRTLKLRYGDFTLIGIKKLLDAPWIQQLEELQLHSCGLRTDTLTALIERPWPNLHTLDLSLNWLNRTTATLLLTSLNFPALRHLDLGDSDLYDDDIAAIAHLPLLGQLQTLSIRRNDIRTKAAEALAESEAFGNLCHLNLAENHLGDEGIRAFFHATHWPMLSSLNLRNNQMKSDGLYAIVNSNLLPQLRALEITVESDSPAWGHLLPNGQALEMLDLEESELSDDALNTMLRTSPMPPLLGLGLIGTNITDRGIRMLADSSLASQLGELRLCSSRITDGGWAAIGQSPFAEYLCSLVTKQHGVSSLHEIMGDRVS